MAKASVGAAQILDKRRAVFYVVEFKVFRQRREFSVQREISRIYPILIFADISADVVGILQICHS